MTTEKLYTWEEASQATGYKVETLKTKRKRGKISGVMLHEGESSEWRLPESTIQFLLKEQNKSSNTDYDKLLDDWEAWATAGLHHPKRRPLGNEGVTNYRNGLKRFWSYLKMPKDISNITAANVDKAIAKFPIDYKERKCSYGSKVQTLDGLRCFGKYLVAHSLISDAEYQRICKISVTRVFPARKTYLKAGEFDELVKANQAVQHSETDQIISNVILNMLVYTGMRRKELINLKIENIDFHEHSISVINGKGHKNRDIVLLQELETIIKTWIVKRGQCGHRFLMTCADGRPLTKDALRRRLCTLRSETGIDITPHGFRHTFATILSEKGVPVDAIRLMLGHEDLEITQEYLRTTTKDAIKMIRKICENSPIVATTSNNDVSELEIKKLSKAERLELLKQRQG